MNNLQKPVLYYDSHCKFCTKSKQMVERLDNENVDFKPITHQTLKKFQFSLSLSKDLSNNVMYYENKDGFVSYGSYAVFEYFKDKRGLFHILGLIGEFPPIKWFAKEVYRCIALNRYFISRFL